MTRDGLDQEAIGGRLRLAREALELTKAEMADLLECHRSNYLRYESGDRFLPPRFVEQLMIRYGLSYDFLYGGREMQLPGDIKEKLRAVRAKSAG